MRESVFWLGYVGLMLIVAAINVITNASFLVSGALVFGTVLMWQALALHLKHGGKNQR